MKHSPRIRFVKLLTGFGLKGILLAHEQHEPNRKVLHGVSRTVLSSNTISSKLSNITTIHLRRLVLPPPTNNHDDEKTSIANTPTTNTHKICGTSGTLRINHCTVLITNVLFPIKHFLFDVNNRNNTPAKLRSMETPPGEVLNVSLQRLARGHRTIYPHVDLDQCHQLSAGLAGQFPGLPTCVESFKATLHPPNLSDSCSQV